MWAVLRWLVLATVFVSCGKSDQANKPAKASQVSPCAANGTPEGAPGKRKLALLVGVEHYRSEELPDLAATAHDLDAMVNLLTDEKGGYNFPTANVCVLRNDQATVAAVRQGFEGLIAKATPGDSVVFYYSGHGAQVPDNNHDETDGSDEAFVFYDSLTADVGVLRDDDMNEYLARLSAKTKDVTVLLDSCTSAGATRGTMRGKAVDVAGGADLPEPKTGEGGYWTAASLEDVVVLAAARDGASAFEPTGENKLSYFTAALVQVLGQVTDQPMTWSQVARQIPQKISQMSENEQFPVAQGNLERVVFSDATRDRPLGWEVHTPGTSQVLLEGAVPLPGWGVGAELAVYDGNAAREVYADPAAAKAILRIDEYDNVRASATVVGTPNAAILAGDLAVLTLPGPDAFRLEVTFDKEVPAAARDAVRKAIEGDPEAKAIVSLVDAADFRVRNAAAGALRLVDADGITRNTFSANAKTQAKEVKDTLVKHARQRALMALHGVGDGGSLQDNVTIEVQIVKNADQPKCARSGWAQSCPNQLQRIPLCNRWNVMVRNTHPTETLRVYGVVLASDGEMLALPSDGQVIELPPRSEWKNLDPGQPPFKSVPPVDVVEGLVVFGSRRDVHVNTQLLETKPNHPIETVFESFTPGATRGTGREKEVSSLATVSYVPYRVVANMLGAPAPDATCEKAFESREYTIQNFDITPYLPEDPNAPLHKVLQTADALTKREIPYLQHDWSGGTDEANLSKGIDCSRSIWWAFTRTDLPYVTKPASKNYIATAEMFDAAVGSCRPEYTPEKSPMHENFDSCMDQPFQTGDVLVFQGVRPGSTDCVGHTVMVIDPGAFIGWGSHGWDGSKNTEGVKQNDTGVEFQVINSKTWGKWDRPEFALKACWRHHAFVEQPEKNMPPEDPYVNTPASSFCDKCDF